MISLSTDPRPSGLPISQPKTASLSPLIAACIMPPVDLLFRRRYMPKFDMVPLEAEAEN